MTVNELGIKLTLQWCGHFPKESGEIKFAQESILRTRDQAFFSF